MRPQVTIGAAAFFVGVLLIAIYWPGLHGAFFFDDEPNLLYSEGLRLETLTVDSIRDAFASGRSGPSGRPVAQLSFALNHYFSGFDPFAFKATNLAIHIANGLLVFFLALRLLGALSLAEPERRKAMIVAGILSAVWLLHPIQLTPVLHVVQRMTSLSAFFLFAALLVHMWARERGGRTRAAGLLLAWGICWPLSFFSKETGVLFPLFALAWELILRRRTYGSLDRFAYSLAIVLLLIAIVGAGYLLSPGGRWLWWAGYDFRSFSLTERLLTEGRVLWFYLGLIFFPRLEALGLYHDDIPISTGLLDPWTTLPAWVGLAGLVWLAWWTRARAPLLSFGIAWFLIGHGLESTILPLEIAHEHRNYVPLFGILLAGAWALASALEKADSRKTLGVGLTVVVMAYFPLVTVLRAHQFGETVRLTQIEAQHHRGSARAQYEAGRALASLPDSAFVDSPMRAFAQAHYERAGELDPNFKLGWLGLIHLNCRAAKEAERPWIEELARRLRETPFAPGDSTVMYSLKEMSISGSLCLDRADIEQLFAAARANPTVTAPVRAIFHSWLADYLALSAGDLPAARDELERSLAIAPYNSSNRLKFAQLAFLQGQREEALGILDGLRNAPLSHSEKETLSGLLACLRDPAMKCMAISAQ